MKLKSVVRMFGILLLLGGSVLIAQDQRDDAKPKQDEARPEAAKPEEAAKPPRQEEAKPPKQDEMKPQQGKPDEMKPKENEPRNQPKAGEPGRPMQAGHDEKPMQHAQGRRIPDDKFRASFGRSHTVVIRQPVVVEGQPRFQFGGYWFAISDPWPADWAYTDDCYIDYVDGEYFLFDLLHPGVRIAIIVVG